MINDLLRLVAPIKTRVANMVARGVLRLVDDSLKVQRVQVLLGTEGEVRSDIERFQNYGFTSVPTADAEAVILFVGGRRDHGLAIAVDDRRYRVRNLESGEVAVYNSTGSSVVLRANGDIQLVPSSGNVTVTGTLTASVDVVGGGKSLKTHTHAAGAALFDSLGHPCTGATGAPT